MSKFFRFKKIVLCALFPLTLTGCAPFVPDNYLSPGTIRMPIKQANGQWKQLKIVPISVAMLNTEEGQTLLRPELDPQPYRIGAFDNLNIIVWGHPEISTVASSTASLGSGGITPGSISSTSNPPVIVQTNGEIFYPYVGHLYVTGLTIDETQNKITHKLSAYIRNPQVTVQVAKYRNRNTYVLGEVKAPGMQPLTDKPLTLMEAISNAGGINPGSADPTHIYLIRGSYTEPQIFVLNTQSPQSLMIAEKFPMQENDIVYVSAATLNSWNNFIGTVLPNFSTYYTIKGLS